MSGKKKSSNGFEHRLTKYKSGQNIIDELTKINNPVLNKKINELIVNFFTMCESALKTDHPHYFLTLLLHEKKETMNNNPIFNKFTKNCMCSFYTSVFRDTLRKFQPEIFKEKFQPEIFKERVKK